MPSFRHRGEFIIAQRPAVNWFWNFSFFAAEPMAAEKVTELNRTYRAETKSESQQTTHRGWVH